MADVAQYLPAPYKLESPMSQTSIELVPNRAESPRDILDQGLESRTTDVEFSLPRADGGRKAYLFLAACWVVEAVTFGKSPHIKV
ncbi:hypothetical protein FPOAC2_12832 [Fusarium poae]